MTDLNRALHELLRLCAAPVWPQCAAPREVSAPFVLWTAEEGCGRCAVTVSAWAAGGLAEAMAILRPMLDSLGQGAVLSLDGGHALLWPEHCGAKPDPGRPLTTVATVRLKGLTWREGGRA